MVVKPKDGSNCFSSLLSHIYLNLFTLAGSFVGIDFSKSHLDLALHHSHKSWRFANDLESIRALAELLRKDDPALIVLEATGGYEQDAFRHLSQCFPVAIVNPEGCERSPAPMADWQHLPWRAVPGKPIASTPTTWLTLPKSYSPIPSRLLRRRSCSSQA